MSSPGNRELGLGIGVVALAVLGYLVLIPFGVTVPDSVDVAAMSPDFWPKLVMALAGLAGLFVVIGGRAERNRVNSDGTGNGATAQAGAEDYRPFGEGLIRICLVIGMLFALYFTIETIGIVVGTMILLGVLLPLTGERRAKIIIPIVITLPLMLYMFFVHVANVPMPIGIFEQFR